MSNQSDEKSVSQAYSLLKSQSQQIMPPAKLDESIRLAASKVNSSASFRNRNKFLWSASVAASVLIVAGVVLKIAVFSNSTDTYSTAIHNKQPMYLLQRSKPVSEKVMILQLEKLIDNNEVEQAKIVFKKFRHYYPEYQFGAELNKKLNHNQID